MFLYPITKPIFFYLFSTYLKGPFKRKYVKVPNWPSINVLILSHYRHKQKVAIRYGLNIDKINLKRNDLCSDQSSFVITSALNL